MREFAIRGHARRWVTGVLVAAAVIAGCSSGSGDKIPLKQLYTPHFGATPFDEPAGTSLVHLAHWLFSPAGLAALKQVMPNQAGVLWLSLLVAMLVAFDFQHPGRPSNVDLLLMQAIGWCFFNILGFFRWMRDPSFRNLMDWVFTAVVLLSLALLIRALGRIYRPESRVWQPGLGRRALVALAVALVASNIVAALVYPPDDAGYFVNIGAQRLRERGRYPYGDPLLTSTPAAAYGPILYLAHLPFQLMLAPSPVNVVSPPRPLIESGEVYYEPPILATKLCTIAFQLLAVVALFVAARRLAGSPAAWAMVALYCSSAFVLGVGGDSVFIGGMTFVSHIAPAATTLLAFALLDRPAWSGVMLATSIGVLFYPIFMVPAWLGYYWRRPRGAVRAFALGFGLTAALIGASVLFLSRPAGGHGRIATIMSDTLGHQERPEAYGSSPFGFWGQRGGVRGWLMTPLIGQVSISRPVVAMFFAFAAAMFVVAQGRSTAQFASIVAVVAMGAQLWKIHATGTYVNWYYPFLLLAVFCHSPGGTASESHV